MEKLNYISIQNNTLVVSFPKEEHKKIVLDILYQCVSCIKENQIKKIKLHLNNRTPTISDSDLVVLINDVFHAVPFAFKVALLHPETESNLQTRFIEQICFSKGIMVFFFNCEETAEVWLEHARTPEISFSRKNMSI